MNRDPFPPTDSSHRWLSTALIFELGLLVVALVVGRLLNHWPLLGLVPWNLDRLALGRDIAWGMAATVPLLVGLLLLDRVPWGPCERLRNLIEAEVMPLFAHCKTWELVLISLAAGIGEEALFRGLIQEGLSQGIGLPASWGIGLVVASLLFGLVHALSRSYLFIATLVGFYFGVIMIVFESVVPCIVAHALYDFMALCYMLHRRQRKQSSGAKR